MAHSRLYFNGHNTKAMDMGVGRGSYISCGLCNMREHFSSGY
jgi:hypothetical protein